MGEMQEGKWEEEVYMYDGVDKGKGLTLLYGQHSSTPVHNEKKCPARMTLNR